MTENISLGQLEYITCLPINYPFDCWHLRDLLVTKGDSGFLDSMFKQEQLHIAPVSSVEYLNNKNDYSIFKSVCLASGKDSSYSVLYSKYSLEELENKTIFLPKISSTSYALLKVLLDQNGVNTNNCNFIFSSVYISSEKALINYDAILYDADLALVESSKSLNPPYFYDLSNEWFNITGLSMVHAVWGAWSDWRIARKADFDRMEFLFCKAIEASNNLYFNNMVNLAKSRLDLDEEIIVNHFKNRIQYVLTEEHIESLNQLDLKLKQI